MTRKKPSRIDPSTVALLGALEELGRHPLFAPMSHAVRIHRPAPGVPTELTGVGAVEPNGVIHLSPTASLDKDQWLRVVAHAMVHLGFGHLEDDHRGVDGFTRAWCAAGCVAVERFLSSLKIGTALTELPPGTPGSDEATLARRWADSVPAPYLELSLNGSESDLLTVEPDRWSWRTPGWFPSRLSEGLSAAVSGAVALAGGDISELSGTVARSEWARALNWFVASYPLIGGLASLFTLVEDAQACRARDISVAAVSPSTAEIYLNPHAGLGFEEKKFVVAHELLHAGLRHDVRTGARDPLLWNYATDYVINGWLVEMGVGSMPADVLYDPDFKNLSSEDVYDLLATNARRARKLATLRGRGLGDVLGRGEHLAPTDGSHLDGLYRRALVSGLDYQDAARGFVPAGLLEEIRALAQPPVPWDVELARWFDDHFSPLEPVRTYARPSRRQGATPDIPRPSTHTPQEPYTKRTFGVVLDTSGSMSPTLLGRALGAIASYAVAHDVPAVRVVFCDAAAYDGGYMDPVEVAERVTVRGRGGTVLQPGLDLLERADDFPKDGPVLVITDGYCDTVTTKRDHAFLIPEGSSLPFTAKGPVFRFT